jgi:hypothetical protein
MCEGSVADGGTETVAVWLLGALLVSALVGAVCYFVPWVLIMEMFFEETETLGIYG